MISTTRRPGALIALALICATGVAIGFRSSRGVAHAAPAAQQPGPYSSCCVGTLDDDDDTWGPPSTYAPCHPLLNPAERRYYDAYGFTAYARATWTFTTCHSSQGDCPQVPLSQGGFSEALYIYRDRFYPEAPCWNLVAKQTSGGGIHCPSHAWMETTLDPGNYILVVSSESAAFSGNGQPNGNGTGNYHLKGFAQSLTPGEYPGDFFCSPAEASDLVSETCTDQIDVLDRKTTAGHASPTSYGSCSLTSGTFRYDVHTINVTERSPWNFSMCGTSPAWDSRLLLYRNRYDPDRPCDNIVTEFARQQPCGDNDWMTAELEPGTYKLVVVRDAWQPLSDSPLPYTLTVSHLRFAGSLACDVPPPPPPPNLLRTGAQGSKTVYTWGNNGLCMFDHDASATTDYVRTGTNPLRVATVHQVHAASGQLVAPLQRCTGPVVVFDTRRYADVGGLHDIPGWQLSSTQPMCGPNRICLQFESNAHMALTAGSAPPSASLKSSVRNLGTIIGFGQWLDLTYNFQ
ncbi:MAG: hypothetical protein U0470_06880 [Anaerolineae bacterium]